MPQLSRCSRGSTAQVAGSPIAGSPIAVTFSLIVLGAFACAKNEPLRPVVRAPDAAIDVKGDDAQGPSPFPLPPELDAGDADGAGDGSSPIAEPVPPGILSDLTCAEVKGQPANAGCSFFALQMTSSEAWDGACFAMALVNPTTRPAKLKIEREGTMFSLAKIARVPKGAGRQLTYEPFDENAGLAPGGVVIVFLAHDRTTTSLAKVADAFCPVPPALEQSAHVGLDSIKSRFAAVGRAFHLSSDRPVVAYQFYPFGGARLGQGSASLLLPEEAWGNDHVAVHMRSWQNEPKTGVRTPITLWHPLVSIVAAADDTQVTITAADDIVGGLGVPVILAGKTGTLTLKAGQFVEFTAANYELSGSLIKSNKPVGLFGGADQMPLGAGPGISSRPNVAQQQIPAQQALGSEYVAVRHRDRYADQPAEVVPWRFVGLVDGTKLSYLPAAPKDAPTELKRGQVIDVWTSDAFVVRSQDVQHPFYLAGHMTGLPTSPRGGPEMVNVVPTAQYLSGYVFFTDPSFPETNLVVVRKKGGDQKFADVELGCAPAPLSGWQPVGDFEYARVDLVKGNYQTVIPGCNNGRNTIRSTAPFTVTVWGWGTDETGGKSYEDVDFTGQASYAYPVGAGLKRTVD
jgi:hypothetical protein